MIIISLKTSKTLFNNLHKTSSSMSQQIFTFSNDSLVTGDEIPVYQNAGMLSEMFNFRHQNNNNPIIPVINLTDSAATTTVNHQNSTLHMLLPNHQFTSQGLSLSLSSTLEAAATAAAAKSEDFRSFYSNQNRFISQDFNYFNTHYHQFNQFKTQFRSSPAAAASSSSSFNLLRNSRYAIAAQELLDEFCSVGRGYFKKSKLVNGGGGGVCGGGGGGGAVKDDEIGSDSLSASDRIEHQRRKVKLLAMLEEVDRRYNNYCEQMQMIVNSFDTIMGHNAALPYTTLAKKAMSRHFRCLKDAIAVQLKRSCERLGDKNTSSSKLTKGETPRLRLLEQNLRQQRAFHQMGMMEQETWRPQRGLPERSVNLLRAWLFEHFLHPYPSDADKHLLARQTGLSRNQVSNWFINARVRLWKPMVEEMYQQESKEIEEENQQNQEEINNKDNKSSKSNNIENNFTITRTTSQTPTQSLNANANANANAGVVGHHQRLRSNNINNVYENDPSSLLLPCTAAFSVVATCQENIGGFDSVDADGDDDVIRFGTNQSGDVSLTLGLRHAGNVSDKESSFSVRDFGGF